MTRMLLRVAAVVAATLTLGGTAAMGVAAAGERNQDVTCHSGDVLTGFYGTVTVPKGNFCELLQATVKGDVIAQNGAVQLGIDNSQIAGSVTSTGITDNGWICGSRIGGNVVITNAVNNPETVNSPGQWDIGFADPNFCGATAFDPVPGNAIGGTLKFAQNASGGELANNDVEARLVCTGNTPPPTGANNQVDKAATGQCTGLTGGTDNDTTSPGDND
jgi:hypothetical protein